MQQTNNNDQTIDQTAWLNDLLQLDHDAVAAYQLALRELNSPVLTSQLEAHLQDHERHIEELERHIDRLGGMKMSMPHASGVFKLAVQAAAALSSDRKVLLAFKANEMQVRDKYARAAELDFPVDIRDTIRRAANDEKRHYDWAVSSLQAMGAEDDDLDVRGTRAFAHAHGRTADAIETAERGAMRFTEWTRRSVREDPVATVLAAGLAVVGAGFVLRGITNR